MDVYRRGAIVRLKGGGKATVASVEICGDNVRYRVSYWAGESLKDDWIEDCLIEATTETGSLKSIGFHE